MLQFDEKTYKKVLWDKMQRKQKNNKKEFLCSVSNTPDQTHITEKWTTYRASKLARLKNRNKQPLYNDDFFSMKKYNKNEKFHFYYKTTTIYNSITISFSLSRQFFAIPVLQFYNYQQKLLLCITMTLKKCTMQRKEKLWCHYVLSWNSTVRYKIDIMMIS